MSNEASVDETPTIQVANHVLGAKAVPDTADTFAFEAATHFLQNGSDDRVDCSWLMIYSPFLEVKALGVSRSRIAVEEVRHDDEISIGSKLIGNPAANVSICCMN